MNWMRQTDAMVDDDTTYARMSSAARDVDAMMEHRCSGWVAVDNIPICLYFSLRLQQARYVHKFWNVADFILYRIPVIVTNDQVNFGQKQSQNIIGSKNILLIQETKI